MASSPQQAVGWWVCPNPHAHMWWAGVHSRSRRGRFSALRGLRLLSFCVEFGARICNGRVAGDQPGAATSWGSRGTGAAVVDYFLVPPWVLPQVRTLEVTDERAAADHAVLVLTLAVLGRPPAPPLAAEADPCLFRFLCPPEPETLAAAVAALATSSELPALVTAAESAASLAAVEAVARRRCLLVVGALRSAGVRQQRCARPGQHQPRPPAIPPDVQQRFRVSQLRAARQAALPGSQAHAAARRTHQRAVQAARKTVQRSSAEALEQLYLAEHDSFGFHKAYRGPSAPLPAFILDDPDALF